MVSMWSIELSTDQLPVLSARPLLLARLQDRAVNGDKRFPALWRLGEPAVQQSKWAENVSIAWLISLTIYTTLFYHHNTVAWY